MKVGGKERVFKPFYEYANIRGSTKEISF